MGEKYEREKHKNGKAKKSLTQIEISLNSGGKKERRGDIAHRREAITQDEKNDQKRERRRDVSYPCGHQWKE